MDIVREQEDGEFERQEDEFGDWITADGKTGYLAEPDRYHLYVSLACPWAHRTVIVRKLKQLEKTVGMTVVDPVRDERGWRFGIGDGFSEDPIKGFKFLMEAYHATNPAFNGRATVPVLWDKKNKRIVNNSEDDIAKMFNSAFNAFTDSELDLFPENLQKDQEAISEVIYANVNNGVYRAGFAGTQQVYEKWVQKLFESLDMLEDRLGKSRYLVGDRLTEADLRLFCTLVRFDAVYYVHFKCNVRRIVDYPNLWDYLRDIYQHEEIAQTVNLDHIKRHYYITHPDINPTRFVPVGPKLDFYTPHNRNRFSS